MWTIASTDEDSGIWHGNTPVEFNLPAPKKVNGIHYFTSLSNFPQIAIKYEAIFACDGIAINGTGHHILRAKKVRMNIKPTSSHVFN